MPSQIQCTNYLCVSGVCISNKLVCILVCINQSKKKIKTYITSDINKLKTWTQELNLQSRLFICAATSKIWMEITSKHTWILDPIVQDRTIQTLELTELHWTTSKPLFFHSLLELFKRVFSMIPIYSLNVFNMHMATIQ